MDLSINIPRDQLKEIVRELLPELIPPVQQFEPMWSPQELASYLGYKGKRPEKAVYELVRKGEIPEACVFRLSSRKMLFHPDRIRAWQESKSKAA